MTTQNSYHSLLLRYSNGGVSAIRHDFDGDDALFSRHTLLRAIEEGPGMGVDVDELKKFARRRGIAKGLSRRRKVAGDTQTLKTYRQSRRLACTINVGTLFEDDEEPGEVSVHWEKDVITIRRVSS